MITPNDVLKALRTWTLTDVMELVKKVKEEFGVSDIAPTMAMAAPAASAEPEEEQQTEFSVFLTGFGSQKVGVIKAVRMITGAALGEAKNAVEGTASAPYEIKTGISKEEAAKLKKQLEEVGGSVEVK